MRKRILFTLILFPLLALAACAGASQVDSDLVSGFETTGLSLDTAYENALPVNMQLALGTFALQTTEYAVDREQAVELLPLWKAVRSLSDSETTASEEIQGLYKQIESTFSPEQVAAIAGMQLTQADIATIAEEQGLDFGTGVGFVFENLTSEQQATVQAARESGQPTMGFGPGEGAGPGMGAGPGEFQILNPEALAEASAGRNGVIGGQSGVNPRIVEAIIEYLEGIT